MFSERVDRTIYLETSRCRDELYRVLGRFGEVRGVHAIRGLGESAKTPYFIEFSHATGAKTALSAAPQGTVVHGLASQPDLADRFRAVAGPDLPPKPQNYGFHDARYSPYPNSKDKRSSARGRKDERRSNFSLAATVLGPASPMSSSRAGARRTASYERPSRKGHRGKENRPFPREGKLQEVGTQTAVETRTTGAPVCSFSAAAPKVSPPPAAVIESCRTDCQMEDSDSDLISLLRHGEVVSIRLSGLEDSPEDVIALLRAAAHSPLECAKWMMISAHYRGNGNARAALAVVDAMIDVMTNVGMGSPSLRPAVLLRSSCHFDIAKQLRVTDGEDSVDSQYHYERGCDGLREVYGALCSTSPMTPEPLQPLCPTPCASMPSHASSSTVHPKEPPIAPSALPSCKRYVPSPPSDARLTLRPVEVPTSEEEEVKLSPRKAKRPLEFEGELWAERHMRHKGKEVSSKSPSQEQGRTVDSRTEATDAHEELNEVSKEQPEVLAGYLRKFQEVLVQAVKGAKKTSLS